MQALRSAMDVEADQSARLPTLQVVQVDGEEEVMAEIGQLRMSPVSLMLLSWLWVPLLCVGGLFGFMVAAVIDGYRQGRYYGQMEFDKGTELETALRNAHGKG